MALANDEPNRLAVDALNLGPRETVLELGFGDTAKARQLLEQAVKLAPTGLDAWYFYGDFLYDQKEYSKAAEAFNHALSLPPHPDRPLWDKNRRLVIQERLDSIAAKQ